MKLLYCLNTIRRIPLMIWAQAKSLSELISLSAKLSAIRGEVTEAMLVIERTTPDHKSAEKRKLFKIKADNRDYSTEYKILKEKHKR